jgi:hypothetical protein
MHFQYDSFVFVWLTELYHFFLELLELRALLLNLRLQVLLLLQRGSADGDGLAHGLCCVVALFRQGRQILQNPFHCLVSLRARNFVGFFKRFLKELFNARLCQL